MRNTKEKLEQTVLNKRNQEDTPKMNFGEVSNTEVARKIKAAVTEKEERVWVI